MTDPTHPTHEQLAAFGLGRLSADESRGIESHLGGCKACQAEVDTAPDDACVRLVKRSVPGAAAPGGRAGTRSEYHDLRHFARGGLGEVSLGRDAALGREVAVKRLLPGGADDPARRRRFLREAVITGRLEHPGIAPVYGVGEDDAGCPCYAMRFVPGETLRDAIRLLHAAPASAAAFRPLLGRFVSLCNTVAYAHSRGVVHRDIKPANVAVGSFGETVLLDWGLALTADDPAGDEGRPVPGATSPYTRHETATGTVLGTPGYMAPEQAAGQRVGPPADVYSLGATLWTLLTGRPPTESGPAGEAFRALLAVARKAMAAAAADRYPSAAALAADVDHWLADEPLVGVRDPWPVRAGRWTRRRRLLVTGTLAALVVAAVGGAAAAVVFSAKNVELRQAVGRAEANERTATANADKARAASELAATREAEAQANFATACDAVDKYTVGVTESPRLKGQDLHALRKDLLAAAQGFYARLAAGREDSPQLRTQIVNAHLRLADIARETGDPATTERECRAVLALLAQAAGVRTGKEVADESKAWLQLSNVLESRGKTTDALAAARAAADRRHQAYALDPALKPDILGRLSADLRLARLLGDAPGGRTEALEIFVRTTANLRALRADKPADPGVFELLLRALNDYAYTQARAAAYEPAAGAWREVRTLCQAQPAPTKKVQTHLASACQNLGMIEMQAGRLEQAESPVRDAIAIYDRLHQAQPDVTSYRHSVAATTRLLGQIHRMRRQYDEAERVLKPLLDEQLKVAAAAPSDTLERHTLIRCRLELAVVALNQGQMPHTLSQLTEVEKLLRPIRADGLMYNDTVEAWLAVARTSEVPQQKAAAFDAALALLVVESKLVPKPTVLAELDGLAKAGAFADPARAARLDDAAFRPLLGPAEVERLLDPKTVTVR